MRPLGDRRRHVRCDVVGSLWGLLELTESARIHNVSKTGALIDSPVPVALESTQAVRVIVDGEPVAVNAKVRHVRRVEVDSRGPSYLIGLEFMSPPEPVLQSIDHLSSAS